MDNSENVCIIIITNNITGDTFLMKNFDTFGIMIDCSRNAVYTVHALKRFIDLMSAMDYNALLLYTEDTYEVEGEPYFGYFRGRYTQAEIKEIDAYAKNKGIELIPCIQTLAHLGRLRAQDPYDPLFDCNDILLADDERVYALIDKMFDACEKAYTSRRINVGMDEAHMIGLGKYLDIHGYTNRYDILRRHAEKVTELAKKHGFEPMMWSDMFFRLATGGDYRLSDIVITEKERAMVPDGMAQVYWDYYTIPKERYDIMFKNHKLLSDNTWFAGGIWTWSGFTPHNELSLLTIDPSLESCIENGIRNAFMTMWGDGGAECSIFSVLPAMYYAAKRAEGETDMDKIKAGFEKLVGISYDDFAKLDLPDALPIEMKPQRYITSYIRNPSKFMLYNDPFLGRYDSVVHFDEDKYYSEVSEKLAPLTESGEYAYLFRSAKALCDLLEYKYALGARARKAYKAGDKAELEKILSDFGTARARLDTFRKEFYTTWFTDKKPDGYEVTDLRLGGLASRLETCEKRLSDYLSGKLSSVDELEEELLCCDGHGKDFIGRLGFFNSYARAASQSTL